MSGKARGPTPDSTGPDKTGPKETGPRETGPERRAEPAGRLLVVVGDLARELHPRRSRKFPLDLDRSLDRDLGFDSLGRAELLLRLEQAFRVRLPERLLGEAETPRDLLKAVLAAESGRHPGAILPQVTLEPLKEEEGEPADAASLQEALAWHLDRHPDRTHLLLIEEGREQAVSYGQLGEGARRLASGLRRWGLWPGEAVGIMLPTSRDFFFAFFGVLLAGGVPVPIYPPLRMGRIEEHMRRQAGILNNAEAVLLITFSEALPLGGLLHAHVEGLRAVDTVAGLTVAGREDLPSPPAGDSLAMLQYTSGSTGDPKGVILSHANLLANIRGMCAAVEARAGDVFVSWLPLYHDMGLIGAWLGSLYFGTPLVLMSPLDFLVRPESWLWSLHRHKGTLTAAPNFAYELCLRKIADADLKGLDLSSVRVMVNGAEPVSAQTIRRFTDRFSAYGLGAEAMTPSYGLAEAAVAVTVPPMGRGPLIDRIRRTDLAYGGEATPAADEADALEIVSCGRPLPGHEVRIVDATGREVGERREGTLQFRGPSATSGYFRNPEKTAGLFDGDWLDSGDLAYVAGGEVYLTGRVKDIIIRAGRNIHPHEVEEIVGDLDGVRKNCVATFGSPDPVSGTERIVIVAETDEEGEAARNRLRQRIGDLATEYLEGPPDEVVLAPPDAVPKTASGKIRRAAAREIFESGRLFEKGASPRGQVLRLALAGLAPLLRRKLRIYKERAYAAYWWGVLGLAAGLIWLAVIVLPLAAWRWAVIHHLSRLALRFMGIGFSVEGLEHLPARGGILVSNHTSYLDGMALAAAIPGPLAFVAKKELARQFFAGLFLRRVGTLFVERVDPRESLEDSRRIEAGIAARDRLVFFPEGTLTRMPGLLDFRLGAFLVAAHGHVPVVPVTIVGPRSILRGDQWFPRRGSISLRLAEPLRAEGEAFEDAVRLRDAARAVILEACGEPDLAAERVSLGAGGS